MTKCKHYFVQICRVTMHLKSFSLDAISAEFSASAPDVVELIIIRIAKLGNCSRHESDKDDGHSHAATLKSITALSTLLKCRSVKVLGLHHAHCSGYKPNITLYTVLNHAGVFISYTTAWKYLKKLTVESRYLDSMRV